MRVHVWVGVLFIPLFLSPVSAAENEGTNACVECHEKVTPGVVEDWRAGAHAENSVSCAACHGDKHVSAEDAAKARFPGVETCGSCHPQRLEQFKKGKHARAWAAMKAMPTLHWQPMAMVEGLKGCGGCHKIGLKSAEEERQLKQQGETGITGCGSCHTRHAFSSKEASQPRSCQTCHMGFDHAQWEMYSSSKHGVRQELKQVGALPPSTAAPSCQTCHMPGGNHANRTAWGYLAVRLPLSQDKEWSRDRTAIVEALGLLDPAGKRAERFDAVKKSDLCRLTKEDFKNERERMVTVCARCHSRAFAVKELNKGDMLIRQADRLMAEAIREVEGLYKDGILKKTGGYPYAFPDILALHDAPTPIEQKLFLMFMEHRMRVFQGAFHCNPDYTFWYGWSEMVRDLSEIKVLAEELRRAGARKGGGMPLLKRTVPGRR